MRAGAARRPNPVSCTAPAPPHQPQCPVPGVQLKSQATLGPKRSYRPAGTDLLARLNRNVFLTEAGADAAASSAAAQTGDLVLYDPGADEGYQSKLTRLREAAAAAEAAAGALVAAEAAVAAAAGAGAAGGGDEGSAACESGMSAASTGYASGVPAAGAAPGASSMEELKAAAQQARDTSVAAHAAAAEAAKAAGPARCKVFAEAFLVEKLRPHQREGVKFIFSCLCGVKQDGVSGGVLADGMGLGKTFQTVSRGSASNRIG